MMVLHAPGDRVLVSQLDAWEVRRHDEHGEHHRYFAPRGMLHFQLWHPATQISILTPSRLTRGRFEVWRDQVRSALRTWEGVTAQLADLVVPSKAEIAALQIWLVARAEATAVSGSAPGYSGSTPASRA